MISNLSILSTVTNKSNSELINSVSLLSKQVQTQINTITRKIVNSSKIFDEKFASVLKMCATTNQSISETETYLLLMNNQIQNVLKINISSEFRLLKQKLSDVQETNKTIKSLLRRIQFLELELLNLNISSNFTSLTTTTANNSNLLLKFVNFVSWCYFIYNVLIDFYYISAITFFCVSGNFELAIGHIYIHSMLLHQQQKEHRRSARKQQHN